MHFKPKRYACQIMTICLDRKGVVFLSFLFLLFPVKFKKNLLLLNAAGAELWLAILE